MAIQRPDIYERSNPNDAIVDSDGVRGGARKVANLAELYALTNKVDQLKEGVTKVFVTSTLKEYRLIDLTKIGIAAGWLELGTTPAPEPEVQLFTPILIQKDLTNGTVFTFSDLVGLTIFQIIRYVPLRFYTTAPTTLTSIDVVFDSTTGTLTFGSAFTSAPELVTILAYSLEGKVGQVITFPAFGEKLPTDPDFSPNVTVNTGLPLTLTSSNTSVATIVNGNIHIVGVGTTTITASQVGNTEYNAASASRLLTVALPLNNTLPGTLPFDLTDNAPNTVLPLNLPFILQS